MNLADGVGTTQAMLWNGVGAAVVALGSVTAFLTYMVANIEDRAAVQIGANIVIGLGAAVIAVPAFVTYMDPSWDRWITVAVFLLIAWIVVMTAILTVRAKRGFRIEREKQGRREAEEEASARAQRQQMANEAVEAATAAVRAERVPVAIAARALGAVLALLTSVVVRRRWRLLGPIRRGN